MARVADYREISQQYAKEGIRTCILLNGGAAVALLSQSMELYRENLINVVAFAMGFWAAGASMAASVWLVSFLSTRFVDKSERESGLEEDNLRISNIYMNVGLILTVGSLLFFIFGCASLVIGFAFGSSTTSV